jgi:peptidoglycan/xylan/chitin deacetylase (PgdA/CDA1 family)
MKTMRIFLLTLWAALFAQPAWSQARTEHPPNTLHIIAYHDIAARPEELIDEYAITVDQLSAHFAWLKQQGYTAVRIDDVLAASRGERALPAKAVLLTFDDGLASVHKYAYPLLRLFSYPAVVSLMGRWLTDEFPWPLTYGPSKLTRKDFLTDAQIKELGASGLIEFASHSYDLHHGIIANDAGHLQPAAVTRRWSAEPSAREDMLSYNARLLQDLEKSSESIQSLTGKAPRAIIWPFGEYSGTALRAAQAAGMPISFGLSSAPNVINGPITHTLQRYLISSRTTIVSLAYLFSHRSDEPARFVAFELEKLINVPTPQFDSRFDQLIDRVYRLGATHVMVNVPSPERISQHIALLNRITWQLRTRTSVRVFIRWALPASNAAVADVEVNEKAFQTLVEHVALTGIVFETGEQRGEIARAAPWLQTLRREQPDDVVVWAPAAASQEMKRAWLTALGTRSPDRHALLVAASALDEPLVSNANGAQIWHNIAGSPSSSREEASLVTQMRALGRAGHVHFGWGPDEFVDAAPPSETLTAVFSRRAYRR